MAQHQSGGVSIAPSGDVMAGRLFNEMIGARGFGHPWVAYAATGRK